MDREQVSEQPVVVEESTIEEATPAITLSDDEIANLLASAPERLEAVLGKLPEDKFQQHPWVQKQMSRLVTKKTQEIEKQQREQQETSRRAAEDNQRNFTWAQDLLARVSQSTGPQLLQHAQSNPNIYGDIARAQRIIASGGNPAAFNKEEYAKEAYGKVKDRLKTKYADVNYDAAEQIEDLIDMATDANVSAKEKTLRDEMTKEMDAKFTEMRNQLHLEAPQPERGTAAGGSHSLNVKSTDDAHVAYVEGKFGTPSSAAARKAYREQLAKFGDSPDL